MSRHSNGLADRTVVRTEGEEPGLKLVERGEVVVVEYLARDDAEVRSLLLEGIVAANASYVYGVENSCT
ncbi:MAG TPA: hypothetical protein VF375_11215 [Candidatus Limnocylindrales bacterium]